jgi:hypothetical protein
MILQNVFRHWTPLAFVTLAGVAVASTGFAQSVTTPGSSFKRPVSVAPGQPSGFPEGPAHVPKPKSKATKLQEASEQLKQAEGTEARKEALAKLSRLVNEIFDEDLKRRESEVDDIRDRVRKLKALIDKRKKSKDRIVDLQYRIQVNEVAGLGFSVKQKTRSQSLHGVYVEIPGMVGAMGMMGSAFGLGGPPHVGGRSPGAVGGGSMTGIDQPVDPRGNAEHALRRVMAKLKNAKEGEDRQASINELKPALEAYFAADLKVREQEIAGIQSRVANLDKQIERRRFARDEIVSLQLEVLINEADGLGFFSTSTPGSVGFQYYGQGPMTAPGGSGFGGGNR